MKSFLLLLLAVIVYDLLQAQQNVGIGTTTPHNSAILDVTSTTKGLLIPRMTGAQRLAIPTPVQGMIVYQTNNHNVGTTTTYPGLYIYAAIGTGEVFLGWARLSRTDELTGGGGNSSWTVIGNDQYSNVSGGVAIGTGTNPNPSSLLDLNSVSKGFLMPRMTSLQRNAIPSPATGLQVYDVSTAGFWYFNGGSWVQMNSGGGGGDDWSNTANHIYNSNSGNIGIGLNNLINEKLTLKGTALITFVNSGDLVNGGANATLKLLSANVGVGRILFQEADSSSGGALIYSPIFNTISLTNEHNTEASARFYDNGNVGIGTTASSDALSKLHILGGEHVNFTTANGYLMMGNSSGLNLSMSHYEILARDNGNPSPLFLQHDGGVVRIGSAGVTAGNTRLQITNGFSASVGFNGYILLGEEGNANIALSNTAIQAKNNGAAAELDIQPNGGAVNLQAGNVVLASNFNVGIGTSLPTEKLHVNGNFLINSFTSEPIMQLQTDGINKGFIDISGDNIRIGTNINNNTGKLVIRTNGMDRLFVDGGGNVNIGSQTNAAGYIFRVGGKMICEEVKVKLQSSGWPDYVFGDDYTLMDPANLKNYIKVNRHLPNIPSAKTVESNGFELGDMQRRLLEKIEELTLYMLRQQEQIEQLKSRLDKK
jgi:hypothetical protein